MYGTTGSVGSAGDDTRVMSEKVQMLASSIYKEFETMIEKSGEDSVKVIVVPFLNDSSIRENPFQFSIGYLFSD